MQGNNYVASVSVGRFVSVKYEASQTAIIEKGKHWSLPCLSNQGA